jgi:virulence-associated protein VapD
MGGSGMISTKVAQSKAVHKQIAFDLVQDLLKKYYPKPKVPYPQYEKKAYKDLQRFFKSKNWSHRQGSVYISNAALEDFEVSIILESLAIKMPWLFKCINELDITDIGERHSLKIELEWATETLETDRPEERP